MGYGVANGQLLSGGASDVNEVITNQGWSYDPADNTWKPPNSNQAGYRPPAPAASTSPAVLTASATRFATTQQLADYGCGSVSVPWLSQSQTQFTLSPGARTTVVTLNAGDPSVTQPGTYTATLDATSDIPYLTPAWPRSSSRRERRSQRTSR